MTLTRKEINVAKSEVKTGSNPAESSRVGSKMAVVPMMTKHGYV
jgi:hypothetical protein